MPSLVDYLLGEDNKSPDCALCIKNGALDHEHEPCGCVQFIDKSKLYCQKHWDELAMKGNQSGYCKAWWC